jgi:hypothetical protein
MVIILFVGVSSIVILTFILMAVSTTHQRRHRRTGVPRPSVGGVLGLGLIALVAGACSGLFFGGPELRRELARRRELDRATQPASATVESHTCLLALQADTVVVYTFLAPDPATGREHPYRGRETLVTRGEATCQPRAVPYSLAIWYDPADPQRATAQPVSAGDLVIPLFLVSFIGGCFVLIPLAAALIGFWAIVRRKRPDEQQLIADVRLMEAQGFMVALTPTVITAARAALDHATMQRYVCMYNGHLYVSLDFLNDPTEHDAAWNALWRVQAKGWQNETDDQKVSALLRRLQGYPDPMDFAQRLDADKR